MIGLTHGGTGGMVSGEGYHFHQNTLDACKRALDADPESIDAADRYWNALRSFAGHDIRSGGFAIEAFRGCALASKAGVIALARAYRDLFAKTGEAPRAELFDEDLVGALQTRLVELSSDERASVEWVLKAIT